MENDPAEGLRTSTSSTRSTSRPRTAAIAALKAAGKDKGVLVVAVDGGCPGVKSVKAGIIGATSQQYPLLMAADGVQAIADFVKTGKKPVSIDTRRAARSPIIPCRAFPRSTLRKARSSAGVDFPRDW